MLRKTFQKARNPQNWAAQALEFQSFLMGRLPSFLNSVLCSKKEEAEENEGEMAGPREILRTLPAFVAMATLLFLSCCSWCSKL